MTEWITQREAAEILGVHKSRVGKLVAEGVLKSRGGRQASLDRAQVASLAEWRAGVPRRAQEARERRAAEREAAKTYRRPPDDEHDWLSVPQVAELLGVSDVAVNKRIKRDRLPRRTPSMVGSTGSSGTCSSWWSGLEKLNVWATSVDRREQHPRQPLLDQRPLTRPELGGIHHAPFPAGRHLAPLH